MKRFLGLLFLLGSVGLKAATDLSEYVDLAKNIDGDYYKINQLFSDFESLSGNVAIVELFAHQFGGSYEDLLKKSLNDKVGSVNSSLIAKINLAVTFVPEESDSEDESGLYGSASPVSSEDILDEHDEKALNLQLLINFADLSTAEQVQKRLLNNVVILERLYPDYLTLGYKGLLDTDMLSKQVLLSSKVSTEDMVNDLVAIGYKIEDLMNIVFSSNEAVLSVMPAVVATHAPSLPVEPVIEAPAIKTPLLPISKPVSVPSAPVSVEPLVSAPSTPVVSVEPVASSPSDSTWKIPNFDEDQYEDINSTAKQIIKYVIENSPTLRLLTDAEIQTIAKTTAAAKLMAVSQLIRQDKPAQEVVNFLRTSKSILPNTEPVAIPVAQAASEPIVSAIPVATPVVVGPNAQVILDKLGDSITPVQKTALIAHEADLAAFAQTAVVPGITPELLKTILLSSNMLTMPTASVIPAGAGAASAAPEASNSAGVTGSNAKKLSEAGITDLAGFSEEELSKYAKMISFGVPLEAVKRKMVQDRSVAGSSGSDNLLSSISAGKALAAVGFPTTTLPEVAAPIDPKLQEKISFIQDDDRLKQLFSGDRVALLRDLDQRELQLLKDLKAVKFGKISTASTNKNVTNRQILDDIKQAIATDVTSTATPVALPAATATKSTESSKIGNQFNNFLKDRRSRIESDSDDEDDDSDSWLE